MKTIMILLAMLTLGGQAEARGWHSGSHHSGYHHR
jgi:hypothetical protein